MEIIKVDNDELAKAFILFPVSLYNEDENYIRPLNRDVESVFDPKRNKFFRNGQLDRWLVKKDGKIVGRIAAFFNKQMLSKEKQRTGGIGFFESIDDQRVANLLFDTCVDYFKSHDIEAMDGPINFGERDKFWGLLIKPFDAPTYQMNYNFPYYQALFENYGFEVYFKQFTFKRDFQAPLSEHYQEKALRVTRDKNYEFKYINKKQLPEYSEYFRQVYNEAWGGAFKGFKEMRKEQAMALMNTMKQVMVEELVWFGFYDGRPVCFFIMLPELNRIFKHVNGELNLFGKLKFLWYRYIMKIKHTYGVVFGVVPDHQRKGVEGAMVLAAANHLQKKQQYETLEMNWIGDFNPKMIRICENVGGVKYRTYHTYRYLFDRSKLFERYPMHH